MNPRNSYLDWQRFVLREWHPLMPPGLDQDKAIRLLLAYASYGDYGEGIYAGSETVAKETRVGERTVKRYRSFFIKTGLLKRTGRKRNRAQELTFGYPDIVPVQVETAWVAKRAERKVNDHGSQQMGTGSTMGGETGLPKPCGRDPRCDGIWHGNRPCPHWRGYDAIRGAA